MVRDAEGNTEIIECREHDPDFPAERSFRLTGERGGLGLLPFRVVEGRRFP